ncbi:MAG: AraC family transcriptional regulator ligand-binding domain-containing protein, partial [Novosphingobium sp.]
WLLDGLAERYAIPDLGLRLAARRRLANMGVAGLVLGQQPTVRAALAMIERYRHLMSDSLSLHLTEANRGATALLGLAIGTAAPQRQSRELGLAAFVHLFRLQLGEHWHPTAVYFTHAPPRGAT